MVCWQISINPPRPPRYCLSAFGAKEISSNLITHGENKQGFKHHTSQVNMHRNRKALLGSSWCVRVRVCLCLEVILSAFSMKPSLSAVHKRQWKAAQVSVDCSLLSLIHWVLLQHTSKHINRTEKKPGCAETTFHRTHRKRQYLIKTAGAAGNDLDLKVSANNVLEAVPEFKSGLFQKANSPVRAQWQGHNSSTYTGCRKYSDPLNLSISKPFLMKKPHVKRLGRRLGSTRTLHAAGCPNELSRWGRKFQTDNHCCSSALKWALWQRGPIYLHIFMTYAIKCHLVAVVTDWDLGIM